MSGQIKKMIDRIIEERARGNAILINTTRTKLTLKGINPDQFGTASPDNPEVIAKLQKLAQELNVKF
jgi:fumarylacetoacetate (FAA) hydrolase family protein